MKKHNLLFGVALLSPFANQSSEAKPKGKSNIIYILADDLGRADLGVYGQQLIETPNIDQLAKEGMTFTDHYSGAPVSAPSRCSLFTGKHMGHAYIRGNDEMPERGNTGSFQAMFENPYLEGQRPIPASTITVPQKLKEAGYHTACIGKWGLGYPGSESTPNKMGFDYFYGYNCQRQAHTYYPAFLYRNEERVYLKNKVAYPHVQLPQELDPLDPKSYEQYQQVDYSPDLMFDEIMTYVDERGKQPFALFWTTPIPHVPMQASQKWIDYYHEKFGEEEPYVGNQGYFPIRYPKASYAAMISYLDEQVGLLIDKLKAEGLYDNTLIIFTSDNGPTFNGGSDSPWFDSAKPYKSEYGWGKTSVKEGGIRVPMLAVWKNKIKPNSTTDHISAFWDIMPTLCEVVDVKSPQTDGISFLPTLLGKKQSPHEYLYWEFGETDGAVALRMGKWKGIVSNIHKGNREVELYNLELDPREHTNVAKYHPEVVELIKQKMVEAHETPQVDKFKMFEKLF